MNSQKKQSQQKNSLRTNEKKWTPTLMKAGWSTIPNIILECQKKLGLDAMDINILLHLVRHWWFSENLPHPTKKTIAKCIDVDPSTIRRHIMKLENAKFIKRVRRFDPEKGQQANIYDLSGLIKAATPYAQEALDVNESRRTEDTERRKRMKPRIKQGATS